MIASANPFIALYDDPVFVLGSLAYALLLLAASIGLVGVTMQTADRGWKHVLWLSNSWEWHTNDVKFGPEWEWYYPPPEVRNRVSLLFLNIAATVLLLAIVVAMVGAAVYVVGQLG